MTMNDNCRSCGHDTSFGSGRFVNRVPADDGFICAECCQYECDVCDELIPFDEDIWVEHPTQPYRAHEHCVDLHDWRYVNDD